MACQVATSQPLLTRLRSSFSNRLSRSRTSRRGSRSSWEEHSHSRASQRGSVSWEDEDDEEEEGRSPTPTGDDEAVKGSSPLALERCGSYFSSSIILALNKTRLWERARQASRLRAARRRGASGRLFDVVIGALAQAKVAELVALRGCYTAGVASSQPAPSPFGLSSAEGARASGFEPWVTLKVGVEGRRWLGAEYEVYSLRLINLQRAPGVIGEFFSDAANAAAAERDEAGRVVVRRPFKHFQAIADFLRDGSCEMPLGYRPSTYDTRPATKDDDETLELLREAHAYRLQPLVDLVSQELVHRWARSGPEMRRQLASCGFSF